MGCLLLTDTGGGEESGGDVWRQAVLEGRLQDVIGERERDNSQRGGIHDEDGTPQQQEPTGHNKAKVFISNGEITFSQVA